MLLEGKTGLVTGGGDGIGRATAIMFARDGARVAVADIRLQAAEETAALIREAGGEAIAIEVDVASEAAVKHMVDTTGNSYQYIEHYAEKIKMSPYAACLKVLGETEKVMGLILTGTQPL